MRGRGASLDEAAAFAVEELDSALDLVRWGASRFAEYGLHFGHGTDNALDEAMSLVLHALHLKPDVPDTLLEAKLTRDEKNRIVSLLRRRIEARKPAAYLSNEAWFAGLCFYVDERVLVPRSPLAEWIERGFEPWIDPDRVYRVLDLATGSGCIAIACAMAFPEATVDASDISAEALEVADINVRRHQLNERVKLIRSDGFDALQGGYDLIVSNPPYVPDDSYRNLPEEYLHEPEIGLRAGPDGLDIVASMLTEAPRFMNPGALLVVEVGEAREALTARFCRLPFLWLDFERGGDDVFALTKEELEKG
jgi:ribosomal protein L3 glutamine methyltransferase